MVRRSAAAISAANKSVYGKNRMKMATQRRAAVKAAAAKPIRTQGNGRDADGYVKTKPPRNPAAQGGMGKSFLASGITPKRPNTARLLEATKPRTAALVRAGAAKGGTSRNKGNKK